MTYHIPETSGYYIDPYSGCKFLKECYDIVYRDGMAILQVTLGTVVVEEYDISNAPQIQPKGRG